MNEQLQQQLLQRLDALAQKLGIAATAIWNMYVQQARIDGLECVVFSVLSFVATGILSVIAKRRYARPLVAPIKDEFDVVHTDTHDDASWIAVCAFLCLIPAFICGCNAIDLLLNPQLVAFQRILEALKN